MTKEKLYADNFNIGFYSGDRITGDLSIVSRKNGQTSVKTFESVEAEKNGGRVPVLVGIDESHRVILLDPETKDLHWQNNFPAHTFPAHIYEDSFSDRAWFMNDGDKKTGNDVLNCGDKGSSVTIVENISSSKAKYLNTVCVGRGHHQAAFSGPSDNFPNMPRLAFISNLKDGTISVVGNDPSLSDQYLRNLATINLFEKDREDLEGDGIPNNSFPHGLAYSKNSGKIYNLNNGYGMISVISPETFEIVDRIDFKGHSNLFITPDGRYIIGRGADRKSDPSHVIAKLTVLDTTTHEIGECTMVQDVYISKYYFNPEGSKLYLTTGVSGSPEQQKNLKTDVILSFDLKHLPSITLTNEVSLDSAIGSLSFISGREGLPSYVCTSNTEKGSLSILSGVDESIEETICVTQSNKHSRAWLL